MARLTDDGSDGEAAGCNPDISESKSVSVKETAYACADNLGRNSLDSCESRGVVIGQVPNEFSQR